MTQAGYYDQSYPPSIYGPDKGSASNGDKFPAEDTITAEDATNAAKLGPLGYVADPLTAWTVGQRISVGTYRFSWTGTAWQAGPVPVPPPPPATGATAGTPGSWTPAGSAAPATVATIGAVVASPGTAWAEGQYVQTKTAGAAGQASWSGTAWVAGPAPAP